MLDTRSGPWLVLGGLLLLHVALMAVPPLNGDEAFYWEWSRRLAMAYPTHPPLTAWAIALVARPLGATEFTVRLVSLLWHAGTLALVWRMAVELGGGAPFARRAVLLAALLPVLFLLGTLITTDSALIFLWTATAYLTKRAIVNRERRAWLLAGLTAGGMLLTKFFAALFVPGVLLFLLAHRGYRRELLRPEPYAGLAIALLLFTPVIYWNATHDWLTFRFNLVARHRNEGFDPFKVAYFVVGQAIAASPVSGALLVAALRRYLPGAWSGDAVTEEQHRRRDGLSFYACLAAAPLLIYLAQSPFIHVGAHWAAVVYPPGALLVAAWLHEAHGGWNPARIQRPALWIWSLAGAAAVIAPLAALMLAPAWVVPARLRYLDPQQPVQHLVTHYFGWKEVGARIAALREEWAGRPEGFFLSTRDYSIASMLDFYTPGRADFVLVGYKKTEFHGKEFLLWARGRKPKGASTIYVSDTPPPPGKPHPLTPYFERIEPLEPLVLRDGRGILRIFYFTAGHGYRANEHDTPGE
jgi:4-amino-4-deoxy-L-arabinose transferase-like glycosyltransferase